MRMSFPFPLLSLRFFHPFLFFSFLFFSFLIFLPLFPDFSFFTNKTGGGRRKLEQDIKSHAKQIGDSNSWQKKGGGIANMSFFAILDQFYSFLSPSVMKRPSFFSLSFLRYGIFFFFFFPHPSTLPPSPCPFPT